MARQGIFRRAPCKSGFGRSGDALGFEGGSRNRRRLPQGKGFIPHDMRVLHRKVAHVGRHQPQKHAPVADRKDNQLPQCLDKERGDRGRGSQHGVELAAYIHTHIVQGVAELFHLGGRRAVFDAELVRRRRPVVKCLLGQLLLPAQLLAVVGQRTQHRCRPLAVQLQRVERGRYFQHTPGSLFHSLQDPHESLVHILFQQPGEILYRHLRYPRKRRRFPEHARDHLRDGRRRRLRHLAVFVQRRRHAQHIFDRYVGIRRNTCQPLREVHDISLVGGRGHTQLVDSRAHFQHTLLQPVLFLQVKDVYQFPDFPYGIFGIVAEIPPEGHVDLVRCPHKLQNIVFPRDTQLAPDTRQLQQVVPRRPGIQFSQFLAQLLHLLTREVRRLHRVRQRLVIGKERIAHSGDITHREHGGCYRSSYEVHIFVEPLHHRAERTARRLALRSQLFHTGFRLFQLAVHLFPFRRFGVYFRENGIKLPDAFVQLRDGHAAYRLLPFKGVQFRFVFSQRAAFLLDTLSNRFVSGRILFPLSGELFLFLGQFRDLRLRVLYSPLQVVHLLADFVAPVYVDIQGECFIIDFSGHDSLVLSILVFLVWSLR